MPTNETLHNAKVGKNNEFYTLLDDVETELCHYSDKFRNKTVLCNCDDSNSAFWEYFHTHFAELGLKKLIATHYDTTYPTYARLYEGGNDSIIESCDTKQLTGNGDFRSDECLDFLEEADIVVTNPPFTMFKEMMALLMHFQKQFLIIGSMNALSYKEIFPLFRDNKVWYGVSIHSGDRKFYVPNSYPLNASGCGIDPTNGKRFIKVKGVRWFTNLDHQFKHKPLALSKRYAPEDYPLYDNFDAININSYKDIPCDYDGVMGVPITFMDHYCPEQFEIVGWSRHNDMNMDGGYWHKGTCNDATLNGKQVYRRILIRKK